MTAPIEVIYFKKPCPHCKTPLERIEKMSAAWSQCPNDKCVFLTSQPAKMTMVRGIEIDWDPEPYAECYNRR